jgi:hypothetical protein
VDLLLELLLDGLVDGLGYLILRYVLLIDKRRINPNGAAITVAGMAGWAIIVVVVAAVWSFTTR